MSYEFGVLVDFILLHTSSAGISALKLRQNSDTIMRKGFSRATPRLFLAQANRYVQTTFDRSISKKRTKFSSLFGVSAVVCAEVWNRIVSGIPRGARPIHLLWALFFLKSYSFETISSSFFGVTPKTFRKWCWVFVRAIADMEAVREPILLFSY